MSTEKTQTEIKYQNINTAKNDFERIVLSSFSDGRRALSVVFDDYQAGTRVQIVVPWQSAFSYWRATGHNVSGVLVTEQPTNAVHQWSAGAVHMSFAKWQQYAGVWRVIVGASHREVLRASAHAEYIQNYGA